MILKYYRGIYFSYAFADVLHSIGKWFAILVCGASIDLCLHLLLDCDEHVPHPRLIAEDALDDLEVFSNVRTELFALRVVEASAVNPKANILKVRVLSEDSLLHTPLASLDQVVEVSLVLRTTSFPTDCEQFDVLWGLC